MGKRRGGRRRRRRRRGLETSRTQRGGSEEERVDDLSSEPSSCTVAIYGGRQESAKHTLTRTNVAKTFGKKQKCKMLSEEKKESIIRRVPFIFFFLSLSPRFLFPSRPAPFPVQIGQMTLLPSLISHPGTLPPLSRTSSPELSEQEGRRTGPSYPGSSFAVRSLAGCCHSSRAGGGGLFLPFSLLAICLSIVSEEGARGGDRPESRYCTLGTLSAQDNPQKSGSHGFCAVAGII